MLTLSDTENNLHFILILQGLIQHKDKGEKQDEEEEREGRHWDAEKILGLAERTNSKLPLQQLLLCPLNTWLPIPPLKLQLKWAPGTRTLFRHLCYHFSSCQFYLSVSIFLNLGTAVEGVTFIKPSLCLRRASCGAHPSPACIPPTHPERDPGKHHLSRE